MGGKKGGGARTPTIQANTLHSAQRLKVVDLISSGEIFGFKHGNDEPLKSILLNGTPIQNQDGSLNFSGVKLEFNRGATDQDYLPSASSSDKSVEVRAQVKKNTPVTRTIENKAITSIRVTVGVDALMNTTKEGDQLATSVSMSVMIMKNDQIHSSKVMTLSEKGSKPFQQDLLFDDLPEAPFDIRCVRNTADSNSDMLRNDTYFFSYVESIDAKMRYPMSAIASLEMDSAQFGGSVPTRNYDLLAKIVQVPSNYDPVKRTYSGLWDRLFKPAHTNNPAWILYDLLTDNIDGFGYRDLKVDIDKLYEASKYCDELVDDGAGGKEPRFVCNSGFYGDDAYTAISNICSSFRAVFAFNGDVATVYYDRAHDVTAVYNNSNVVDGIFDYSMTKRTEQYNQVQVQFADEENGYETTIIEVSDDEHIALHGLNTLSVVGFGITKRSYAIRNGKWTLTTNLSETVPVSFNVGAQGIKHEVYDIIEIADNDFIGEMLGARVLGSNGNKITLDREIKGAIAFSIDTTSGRSEKFKVKRQLSAKEYELESIPNIVESAACNAMLASVEPRLFRCLDIAENDDGTYQIVAIQHNPKKEEIVDNSAEYLAPIVTTINPMPSLTNGFVSQEGRAIVLEWDSLAVAGSTNTYRIQLFKDKVLYRSIETKETSVKLESLPQGEYVAKIRAINERGQFSEELVIAFSTSYKISGLRAKGVVFGIELNWEVPSLITSDAHTEIWFSDVDDRKKARKMAVVTYPQSHYSLSGLSIGDELYFWFRLVDADGNQGEFTHSIKGEPSKSADDIKGYLEGQITTKELSSEVIDEILNKTIDGIKDDVDQIISESDVISELNKQIGDAELEQRLLELSKSSGDGAIFAETQINRLSIDNAYSEIILQKVSQATSNKQLASQYLSLLVENERAKAELMLSQIAQTTDSKSLVQEISSLTASFLLNTASIDSLKETTATEFKATAKELSKLEVSTAKNSAAITQNSTSIATTDGHVNSQYTLTTETTINGEKYVSGFTSKQDGKTSEFVVQADKFAIVNKRNGEMQMPFVIASNKMFFNGDMIATGSISGDKLIANTSIQAPIIKGGRIESGHIAGGSINIGNGNFSVDSNGNLIAKSGRFEGTVYADRIEGDVIKRVTVPNFNVIANRETHINGLTLNCKEIIIPPANFDRYFTIDSLRVSGGGDPRVVGMWQITIDDSPLYLNKRNVFSPFEVLTPGTGFIVKKGVVAIMSFVYSTNYQGSAPSLRISNLSLSYSKVDSMETIRVTDGSRYYGRSDTNNNTSITIGES